MILLFALMAFCLANSVDAQTLVATVTPTRVIKISTTNEVTITFNNGPNPTVKDFITLVPDGAVPVTGRISNWFYLNNQQTVVPSAPIKSGVLTFPVPGVGRYQAYLFRNGSAVLEPVGKPIDVDVELTEISLDGPAATLVRTNSLADDVSIVIVGDTATITAPTDSPVKVNQNPAPGMAVFTGKQAVKKQGIVP